MANGTYPHHHGGRPAGGKPIGLMIFLGTVFGIPLLGLTCIGVLKATKAGGRLIKRAANHFRQPQPAEVQGTELNDWGTGTETSPARRQQVQEPVGYFSRFTNYIKGRFSKLPIDEEESIPLNSRSETSVSATEPVLDPHSLYNLDGTSADTLVDGQH